MSDKIWQHQLEELKVVMAGWEQKAELTRDIEVGQASELREWFPSVDYRKLHTSLDDFGRRAVRERDREIKEFLRLPAVTADEPVMFPIAKLVLKVRHDELHLGLRIAVLYDHEGETHAHGWRFESADDRSDGVASRFHHFPHVQRIIGWSKGVPGLHPQAWAPGIGYPMGVQNHLHEIRPAFPLRGRTPAGIAVAAMASLYGAPLTLEYLEGADASCTTCNTERLDVLCHDGGGVG
ncbi:hypothetical protein HWD99_13600 [Microbacterium sp. C5A9]|uniref:hypothetical protein n=1 Tax=Microbacterium sp. C5A9 TaxID=2736663 RepID=UPI001F51B472|nr:hypothetical protein [Microbacterium sp. C5A9]MCI1019660.1 hypothetical protein [Microbacterium sp. C5A9]